MPLTRTNRAPVKTPTGSNYQTTDENNNSVIVQVSEEFLQDNDEFLAIDIASWKYDDGIVNTSTTPNIVSVFTKDYKDYQAYLKKN